MATFNIASDGEIDDRARIILGDGEARRIVESYEISQRLFQQPSAFALRLGSGESARDIIRRGQPNTDYRLFIGPVLQQSGKVDGFAADPSKGATEITLRGRDALARLIDDHIPSDRSFVNTTFAELVVACLDGAGFEEWGLAAGNEANRLAVAGAQRAGTLVTNPATIASAAAVTALTRGLTTGGSVLALQAALDAERGASGGTTPQLHAKAGGTWWAFLKPELDRGALFLIAAADRNRFVLFRPRGNSLPLCELVRQRGAQANAVTVLDARYENNTQGRYARYVIRGRASNAGVKKAGRTQLAGEFVDQEMVDLGFTKRYVAIDPKAKNAQRADFLARRKCAEDRRQGWILTYTVKGHSAPLLSVGGAAAPRTSERAVWTVDTTVRVRDDEFGIFGDFYIEGVVFRGGPQGTSTELTLVRPDDLVFGEG